MANILLLGATGRTGGRFLKLALEAGHRVTAVVRSALDVEHDRLTVQQGSATDPELLDRVMPGHEVVVSTLGPRWPSRSAAAVYPDSAEAIVPAMWNGNVPRLLVTSSALLFRDDSWLSRLLRRLVPAIVNAANAMETHIRASRVDWTLVRTGFLTDDPDAGHRLGVESLPESPGPVSRDAVAAFLLEELEQPRFGRTVVGLCG